ncbi:hypothetical protein GJ699_30330 [Duganella sp. FT80W]|uniref:Uncharacterized protein n=1 Tax=Duganella guangzhouensis TaxID=2666084 RepID=A0A6I2L7W2_9BURK|nr:hypothetical protein [Duganella guangzhouensis]MRW94281.1 hypothetical protein [Duganella guangzhouensis]
MKEIDLLKALEQYDDNQIILVEAADGGFDEPVFYVSAVRCREGQEFVDASSSEYRCDLTNGGFGALILGTSTGPTQLG